MSQSKEKAVTKSWSANVRQEVVFRKLRSESLKEMRRKTEVEM